MNDLYENFRKNNNIRENKIPKIIHLVWLGSPLPNNVSLLIEGWKLNHVDWEFKVWGDNNISELEPHSIPSYKGVKNLGAKSDIIRYLAVYKYGGIYIDTDFMSVRSFDELLSYDFFGGGYAIMEDDNPEIFNGLFGSVPKHPIIKDCIDTIKKGIDHSQSILNTTGPRFFTKMVMKNIKSDNITVLPSSYFYPFPAIKRHMKNKIKESKKHIKPETFCVHLWDTSWQ